MIIKNINDFCEYWGCDNPDRLDREVYKYTDCGAWFNHSETGFAIGSIVEGSDAEFSRNFFYPVESDAVDMWIAELEILCEDAWHEANDDEEDYLAYLERVEEW